MTWSRSHGRWRCAGPGRDRTVSPSPGAREGSTPPRTSQPLDSAQQCGLLTGDVRAGALHDLHREAVLTAPDAPTQQPIRSARATAALSRASAAGYSERTRMKPRSAPTAYPAGASPSSTRSGSLSISSRSQYEPGRPHRRCPPHIAAPARQELLTISPRPEIPRHHDRATRLPRPQPARRTATIRR